MKKECEIVQDLLFGYNDGVISKSSTELVENHLKECDICKNKLEEIQKDRKEWFDLETKKEHGNIDVFPQKPIKNLNTKENEALQVVKKQNIIIKIIEKIKIMWRKIRG